MPQRSRRRILIVEDDTAQLKLLTRLLEASGYESHPAASGSDALAHLDDVRPELVVLDLGLPDMSGYDVCREIRQRFTSWGLPVLILTGFAKPIDQLRGFACGGDAYLTKPFDPDELLKTVALLVAEPPPALSSSAEPVD